MHDPLHRLYRTKLALLATLLLVAGLGVLIFGHGIAGQPSWHWLAQWPVIDIGSGMFTTGLLGVALQYIDGADSEVRDTERFKRVLADSAPAMRDAVISGFAFEPSDLERVATPEVLDQIATNALAIRLGDASFAADIYQDLREQAIQMPERLYDERISIRLSMDRRKAKGRAPFFVATIRWESTLRPVYATRRFTSLSDIDEFREITRGTAADSAWYVGKRTGLDAASQETFELIDFTVDGEERPIRRSAKKDSQTYTVNLGDEAMRSSEPIKMAYTYRALISAAEHLLHLRVDQPTKGLSVELDYSDTDIERITALDFIASGERTATLRSPKSLPGKTVGIEFDGWAFTRSGVAFVWRQHQ